MGVRYVSITQNINIAENFFSLYCTYHSEFKNSVNSNQGVEFCGSGTHFCFGAAGSLGWNPCRYCIIDQEQSHKLRISVRRTFFYVSVTIFSSSSIWIGIFQNSTMGWVVFPLLFILERKKVGMKTFPQSKLTLKYTPSECLA